MVDDNKAGKEAWAQEAARWAWLAIGALMALGAGVYKFMLIRPAPDMFESLFFSGFSYIILVSGLVVVIVSVGYPLVFGSEAEVDGEGESGSN
jgi:hypothetical protein